MTEDISDGSLRDMCDQFQTKRDGPCVPWVTRFDIDKNSDAWDLAKLALDSYNQKEQKNFKHETVCKLNCITVYFCMILRARNAENDECSLFRCVVYGLTDYDGDMIPGAANYVAVSSQSQEAHSPHTRDVPRQDQLMNSGARCNVDEKYVTTSSRSKKLTPLTRSLSSIGKPY